jgi:hypothetical protein
MPDQPPRNESARRPLRPLGICALLVVVPLALVAAMGFRVYGLDTHHATRDGIWWSETARGMTPPTARDITLQRDLLDHRALYTVSEAELVDFIRERFARDGEVFDADGQRDPLPPGRIGEEIGSLGWRVTAGSVSYTVWPPNGATTTFHHDPATGLTYQESAHW